MYVWYVGVYACVLRRMAVSELRVSSWLVVAQVPSNKAPLKRGQWGHRKSTSLDNTFCRQAMQFVKECAISFLLGHVTCLAALLKGPKREKLHAMHVKELIKTNYFER